MVMCKHHYPVHTESDLIVWGASVISAGSLCWLCSGQTLAVSLDSSQRPASY